VGQGRGRGLQIIWPKASAARYTREHSGSNFFIVMEGEHKVRPSIL
jgi:hypothetical protein